MRVTSESGTMKHVFITQAAREGASENPSPLPFHVPGKKKGVGARECSKAEEKGCIFMSPPNDARQSAQQLRKVSAAAEWRSRVVMPNGASKSRGTFVVCLVMRLSR